MALNAYSQTTTTGMTIVGTPTGLSAYDPGTSTSTTTTIPTIFGGYAGNGGGCASPSSTATCDSCAGVTTLAACNPASIHPNLLLRVTLVSSTASTFQGSPRVRWKFSGETSGHAPVNSITLTSGQSFTVDIPWSQLCGYGGSDVGCTTDTTASTLYIGIDNNNDDSTLEEKVDFTFAFRAVTAAKSTQTAACPVGTPAQYAQEGICDYTLAPGDEKVYISDYAASSNDLTTSTAGVTYNRIAMFYVEGAANATTVTSSSPNIILNLANNSPSEPSISDQRIRGLQNDVTYCFALGNMDQTGNITYFPLNSVLSNASKVCATPSQVVGLLDDKHCFIATATFGSDMAPEVQTFRQFRNQFLLKNTAGKAFVKAYYQWGPEAAEWVSQSSLLKALSLGLLWPLLWFVKLSLAFGILPATLISLLALYVIKKSSALLWHRRNLAKGDA